MEKDISKLSRRQLIKKYNDMESFIVVTGLSNEKDPKQIKETCKHIETVKGTIVFNVDLKNNIKIKAISCDVYRNENDQILMIETKDFVVLS